MVESTRQSAGDRPGPTPWTAPETRRVKDLWAAGMTAADIARALGKSRNAVLGKIGRLGLSRNGVSIRRPEGRGPAKRAALPAPRPRRFAWSRDHQHRLVGLWKEGLAADEIAARLGCTEALVVERATAAGLATVEAPERHSSPRWFARNDARFRAAMQAALDRGLIALPVERADGRPATGDSPRRRSARGF